jgi:hypothetical protein
MFGRVHRSDQAHPPVFTVLVSHVAGESRFASAVAHRMKTLGALTRGDRRAAHAGSEALGKFDYQTEHGLLVCNRVLKAIVACCLVDYSNLLRKARAQAEGARGHDASMAIDVDADAPVLPPPEAAPSEREVGALARKLQSFDGRHVATLQLGEGANATRDRIERAFLTKGLEQFHKLQAMEYDARPGHDVAQQLIMNTLAYQSILPESNDTAFPRTSAKWRPNRARHLLSPKPFREAVSLLLLTRNSRAEEHRQTWGSLPNDIFYAILHMAGDRLPEPEHCLSQLAAVDLLSKLEESAKKNAKEKPSDMLSVRKFLNRLLGLTVEDQRCLFTLFEQGLTLSESGGPAEDEGDDISGDVMVEKEEVLFEPKGGGVATRYLCLKRILGTSLPSLSIFSKQYVDDVICTPINTEV